ncbi:serine-type D-Ala-D-Ala carboxypeptidase, partial [Salmonella enterica subsp. enterica serovar Kentucky]|nr:serine-type D-Ala-D-Ala carboxypeptidase [Salmonella enterica subsp. enterica serovar Kentucky]
YEFPAKKITINLAPADLPKEGGRYDLPIAVALLAASEQLTASAQFVAMMNSYVKKLNLQDTHFETVHGLDAPGQHSSAYDLAVLS